MQTLSQLEELQRELDNLEKLIDSREDETYKHHKELIAKRDYLQTKTCLLYTSDAADE